MNAMTKDGPKERHELPIVPPPFIFSSRLFFSRGVLLNGAINETRTERERESAKNLERADPGEFHNYREANTRLYDS